MKVLFDHIVFQKQKMGGVSKALTEMIRNLPPDIIPVLAVKQSENVYLKENPQLAQGMEGPRLTIDNFLGGKAFRGRTRLYGILSGAGLIPSMEAVNMKTCKALMKSGAYDVLQPTQYDSYFLKYNKKPFVFIVHDLVPELFPQYYPSDFPDIKVRDILVRKADKIVAISDNTKADILARWDIPEEKVAVVHWGAPDVSATVFKRIVPYKYILFVGERSRYKRFGFFVRQASSFFCNHPDIDLICTGRPFSDQEKAFLDNLGLRGRFHQMSVSSEDLFSLYHFAFCFVFPSEYEGFGLPTLEAMACGCPVVLSDSSCFSEIGGDAALYFETSPDGGESNLVERLESLASLSDAGREAMTTGCLERAAKFTWKETAQKYADIYRNL